MNIGHVDKLKECDICGEKVYARGLGGHKRLKHGIVVRIITKSNSSTQVSNVGTQVSNSSTQVSNVGTQVKRSSTYVKVSEKIVKTENVSAFKEPEHFNVACSCSICHNKLQILKCNSTQHPYYSGKDIICNDCLKRFKKEDLHGEFWHVPNTNNQHINVIGDYFVTEDCKLVSEYIKEIK